MPPAAQHHPEVQVHITININIYLNKELNQTERAQTPFLLLYINWIKLLESQYLERKNKKVGNKLYSLCDLLPLKMKSQYTGSEWEHCHGVPRLVMRGNQGKCSKKQRRNNATQTHKLTNTDNRLKCRFKGYGARPSLPWDHRCQRGAGRSQRWWRKQHL